jgi:hypothetical protein
MPHVGAPPVLAVVVAVVTQHTRRISPAAVVKARFVGSLVPKLACALVLYARGIQHPFLCCLSEYESRVSA